MPFKYPWENKGRFKQPAQKYQLPIHLEHYLFDLNHDYLIKLRFEKIPAIFSYMTEEYFIESARQFWPLRFTLYSTGTLYLADNQIPKGLNDRVEIANAYLEKAATFNFFENNNAVTVLTLAQLAFSFLRVDRKEAYLYANMGLVFAKYLGINTEEGIAKLTPFDYERENIRGTWWLLYNLYSINPKKFGDGAVITDADNQIFLPSNIYFESNSDIDYYGIEVMSNAEWYVPSLPNMSFQAYRIVLHKITHKILNYVHLELLNETENIRYIAGTLDASLKEWHCEAIHLVNYHAAQVRFGNVKDPQTTWLVLSLFIMYNNARVELIIPNFMKNIIRCKKIENSLYFKAALSAAINNVFVLQLIKSYNQKFEHLHAYIIYLLFVCAFLLQCCIKLPFICNSEIIAAYEMHVELLALHGKVFQRTALYYQLILQLNELDIHQAVLAYGEFRANGFSPLSKPTTSHVELFDNLSIK
ncbi:hypothetical protein HDV01_001878 [Terramyces sp. JEL0728]|nr:hypothetical protein HDV01_001878 [Terramyces sp. JEL0728]